MVTAKDGIWRQKGRSVHCCLLNYSRSPSLCRARRATIRRNATRRRPPLILVEAFGGAIDVPKFLEATMHSKTFFWSVGVCVLVLALGTSVVAQDRSPEHFRGIINDFTAAHDANGKPSGPWELHGVWRLDLSRDGGTAD